MTLDWILLWIAIAHSVVLLATCLWTRRRRTLGWMMKCVAVLAIAGLSWRFAPDQAPWMTGGAWLILIAVPLLLVSLANRSALRARYAQAWRLSRLVRLLHPFDGWRATCAIMASLALAHAGDTARAIAGLSRLLGDPKMSPQTRGLIEAHLCRLTGDWETLARSRDAGRSRDPAVRSLRLRALGETGRLKDLVREFGLARGSVGMSPLLDHLFLLVFCGRRAAVGRLLNGGLAALDADNRNFWLGTAELAGGEGGAGRARLAALAGSASNAFLAEAAQHRLRWAPASPQAVLDVVDWEIVDAAEDRLHSDAAYIGGPYVGWRRSYAILGLVLVNLAVYLVEAARGATHDPAALWRLGAMFPVSVIRDGEWWRLGSAMFLHLGAAHLVLNMVALAAIGIWVERMLGHWRTLLLYLLAGVGSTAGVLLLMQLGWTRPAGLVGASGAIFGLAGAQGVLLALGWRYMRSRIAGLRLLNIGLIILLQAGFDLSTPQVSASAHIMGLSVGLVATPLAGWGLLRRQRPGSANMLPPPARA